MDDLFKRVTDLFSQKKYSELLDIVEDNLVEADNNYYLLKIKAASLFCIGSYQAASELLSDLDPFFGESADYLSLYAATARCLGDYTKSKALFLKALSIEPNSLQIKNNYSNLLIDLQEYADAQSTLVEILEVDPLYADAISNLNRLRGLMPKNSTTLPSDSIVSTSTLNLDDPLLLAFNNDEIDFSRKRYIERYNKKLIDSEGLSDQSLKSTSDSVALDQLNAASIALTEKNSLLVLKLCSQARLVLPTNPRVYEYASDAYLNLKKFREAECALMHSILLGGSSLKHYFNLVTFARMRSDFSLALFYLDKAAEIDPSAKVIIHLRDVLLSESQNQLKPFSFSTDWPDTSSVNQLT